MGYAWHQVISENYFKQRGDKEMSISKKNTRLLFIIALLVFVALFAVMFAVTTYAGAGLGSFDPHFVADCAGSPCGLG